MDKPNITAIYLDVNDDIAAASFVKPTPIGILFLVRNDNEVIIPWSRVIEVTAPSGTLENLWEVE